MERGYDNGANMAQSQMVGAAMVAGAGRGLNDAKIERQIPLAIGRLENLCKRIAETEAHLSQIVVRTVGFTETRPTSDAQERVVRAEMPQMPDAARLHEAIRTADMLLSRLAHVVLQLERL